MTDERTIDDHFRDWESHVFGFGYGSGEPFVLGALLRFMELATGGESTNAYDYHVLERELGGTVTWLLLNALCRSDIIEYGGSPRFGWLTPEGERLREYMGGKPVEELCAVLMEGEELGYDDHLGPRGTGNPFVPQRR